jgi:membrane-associated protein
LFNVIGAALWITSMIMAGSLLGRAFPDLPDYLEIIVIGMILFSAIPVALTWFRARRKMQQQDKLDNIN